MNETQPGDPLPSWRPGATRDALLAFFDEVGQVPIRDRVAYFDNDGTLWAEQPMYVQLLFAIDRVKALAPQHPEWKDKEPFASLLKGDVKNALAGGEHAILEIVQQAIMIGAGLPLTFVPLLAPFGIVGTTLGFLEEQDKQ